MKRIIATLLLSILSFAAMAQQYEVTRIGLVKDPNGYTLNYPTTTIAVEVLIEKEVVTPGIYARYAQKYLAQRAPLVASESYKIIDGSIGEISYSESARTLTPAAQITEYGTLPIDQNSSAVLSADDAAREAAEAIFAIRRQRRDIINGEAGEGYFGGGLGAAIDKLDRVEKEYLDLFMGSRTTTQSVKRYVISLQEGVNRYFIARFDSKGGILPSNDLTGMPVYLQLNPMAIPSTDKYAVNERTRESIWFRIAAPTECVLFNDSEVVTSSILSIYELGKDVQVETVSK